jgi:hypothetical protein
LIICVLEWSAQDLVASWTLVGNKTGATRLGFAVLLKFFEIAARFPSVAGEVPAVRGGVLGRAEHLHVTADAFLVDRFYVALSDGAPRPSPSSPSKNRVLPAEVAGDPAPSGTHPRHDQLPGDP